MTALHELPEVSGALTDDRELQSYRENNWAARSERGIEIFTYEQGMQALDHPDLLKGPSFQYRLDQLGIQGEARRYMDMGITNKEGEERRQMRASMGALFRPTQIAKLRGAIREIARQSLDEVGDPSAWDVMHMCWRIPALTYCELVSAPYSEADTVIRIADSVLGTLLTVDRSRRDEAEAAIMESVGIVREHLNARRGHLGDDFTSVMIRQQEDGLMTEDQLVAQSFALLQASVDNTAHQMGNTFGMLLSQPDRWEALIRDPSLRGPIIEEAIRLHPRFGTIFRLAATDTVIDDLEIPEGTWTFVSARAGQRDPSVFEAPDDYRLDRQPRRPLMFGAGPYNCLGQNLARMEIEEALGALAERYPNVRLRDSWKRQQANAVSETVSLSVDLGTPAQRAASPTPSVPEPVHATHALRHGEAVLDCEITSLTRVAQDILAIDLRAHDGTDLPSWQPGSHVDLVLPNGLVRQYSLCGPRDDHGRYRVAVLREQQGSGGSEFVHQSLSLGQRLEVRGPRNNFELEDAPSYHFVAGGIGMTAILPMVAEAERRQADWTLVYLGRAQERLAFLDELSAFSPERARVISTRTEGRPSIQEILDGTAPGALLYACGPARLLDDLAASEWPEDRIRFERFEPDTAAITAPADTFQAHLTQSGQTLEVPRGKSLLDVMEEAGVTWPYSCREGTCGTCEARIVSGAADHRDTILTRAERSSNESMMVCVSRAAGTQIEIEA